MQASNRLYNGEVGSRLEALILRKQALLQEAGFPPHKDEFSKSLRAEAEEVDKLIQEWEEIVGAAEEKLLSKWISSSDPMISGIAESLLSEDWQSLAI